MPRIILLADNPASGAEGMTLSERILASHLDDDHYRVQLLERLSWAAADAEALERVVLPSATGDGDSLVNLDPPTGAG